MKDPSQKNLAVLLGVALLALAVGVLLGILSSATGVVSLHNDYRDTRHEQEVRARQTAEERVRTVRDEAVKGQINLAMDVRRLQTQLHEALEDNARLREQLAQVSETPVSDTPQAPAPARSILYTGEEEEREEDARDWESRYKYAALKYNRLVADYGRLQKKYILLTGADGGANGIVTGAQLYQSLRESTRQEINSIGETIRKGVRTGKKRQLELHVKELEERERWLRETARRFGIEK